MLCEPCCTSIIEKLSPSLTPSCPLSPDSRGIRKRYRPHDPHRLSISTYLRGPLIEDDLLTTSTWPPGKKFIVYGSQLVMDDMGRRDSRKRELTEDGLGGQVCTRHVLFDIGFTDHIPVSQRRIHVSHSNEPYHSLRG
jgi:hypothetical protein